MARARSLTLDNIEILFLEAASYSETIERIGGFVLLRTVLGSAKRQHNWAKHRISLAGSGPLPPALLEVDHTVSHVLKLSAPQTIQSPSNIITVPTARRGDVPLEAYAILDVDNFIVEAVIAQRRSWPGNWNETGVDMFQAAVETTIDTMVDSAVLGISVGVIVVGLVTGLVLILLLRHPIPEAPAPRQEAIDGQGSSDG